MKNSPPPFRFKDEGNTIWQYLNEIYVHCPKCAERALITKQERGFSGDVYLSCPSCHYSRQGAEISYTLELKTSCFHCGEWIAQSIEEVKVKKESLHMRCPHCEKAHLYQPKYIENRRVFNGGGAGTDPFLYLPLWLCADIGEHTFWAFNYEHLSYLKGYISAKLRTRSGKNITSMVEKLPAWIKSKKNREALTDLIDRLEKK